MPVLDRSLFWLRGDEALPSDWSADSGLTYTPGTGEVPDARYEGSGVAGETGALRRRLAAVDVQERRRAQQKAVVQAWMQVEGNSSTTWPASPGLQLDDGQRVVALLIDTTVVLYDPEGASGVLATVRTGHTPGLRHHYRLEKDANSGWLVYIDEDLVAQVPYERAAASASNARPRVAVGLLDPGGDGNVLVGDVEVGLNLNVPFPSDVLRAQRGLLLRMQERDTTTLRAMTRTIAGMARDAIDLMTNLWRELDGGGVEVEHQRVDHALLPTAQRLAWATSGAGAVTIQRQRWLLTGAVANTRSFAALDRPTTASSWVRATWCNLGTASAGDYLGAIMQVDDGGALVRAVAKLNSTDDDEHYWTLETSGGTELGTRYYAPTGVEHVIELVLVPQREGLLKVDGKVVSRVAWADLDASVASEVRLENDGTNDWLCSKVQTRVAGFPLGQRLAFRQRLAERLIPTTGCERNDTLDRWSRDRYSMHEARGTTQGIREEISRMLCGDVGDLGGYVPWRFDGEWHVDVTFPDFSPVVVDKLTAKNETLVIAAVEWPSPISGFSEDELARIVTKYLFPISVLERVYWFTVAYEMTGPSAVLGSGDVRITVADTSGFEVGQRVQLRDAANTTIQDSFVVNVQSSTEVDVEPTTTTFVATDVIRRLVRHS